jgi:hypothetical protein
MATVTWSVSAVPGQTSQAAPVLAVFGNQLHMVYLGEHDNRIRYAVFPVNGGWSPQGPIGDQRSQAVPALAAHGGFSCRWSTWASIPTRSTTASGPSPDRRPHNRQLGLRTVAPRIPTQRLDRR